MQCLVLCALPALLGFGNFVAALPLEVEMVSLKESVPPNSTAVSNSTSSSSSDCAPLPAGAGPVPPEDNAKAFREYQPFDTAAVEDPIPANYELAFMSLTGTVTGDAYMGRAELDNYDTPACAQQCNDMADCQGFNIYFERSETEDSNSPKCENPPSTTNIRCTFWGKPLMAGDATNTGQWRRGFETAFAGSNGFARAIQPDAVPGFSGPVAFAGAIDAPDDSTYMGSRQFPVAEHEAVNASACAAVCTATTEYNKAQANNGTYTSCAFFNVYVETFGARASDLQCALFSVAYGNSEASNHGQGRDDVSLRSERSYGYTALDFWRDAGR